MTHSNPSMRYLVLAASIVIQVCLGGAYAYSALVPGLQSQLQFSVAQTQIILGCLFGVFTVSMVLTGKLLDRTGPRAMAMVGGVLFGAGYLTASASGGSFWVIFLGISLLAGIGTAAGYVCPLATCMKWFPNHRGFVTGVSVAGFGGGAVLMREVIKYLLADGMHVLEIFQWIGLAYGVALVAAAALLKAPSPIRTAQVRSPLKLRALVRDPFFLTLVVGMFCGTFAGMLVIGNLTPMARAAGIPAGAASAAISFFAVGNAAGRIVWGWLSDRVDQRMIPVKLAVLAAPLVLLTWAESALAFMPLSFAVGFGFGAGFVVYAAQVASRYGTERVGGVYPLVFLAYGVASIAGPGLGGWLFDITASYTPAILLSCAIVGVGILGSLWLLQKIRHSRMVCLDCR